LWEEFEIFDFGFGLFAFCDGVKVNYGYLFCLVFKGAKKGFAVYLEVVFFFEPWFSYFFDFCGFPKEGVSFCFIGGA
jgi:hypothetical protein